MRASISAVVFACLGWALMSGQNADPCGCSDGDPEAVNPCCRMRMRPEARAACLNPPDAGVGCDVAAVEHPFPGGGRPGRLDPVLVLELLRQYEQFFADGWMAGNVQAVVRWAFGEGWQVEFSGGGDKFFWVDNDRSIFDVYCRVADSHGVPVPWHPYGLGGGIWMPEDGRPPLGRLIARPSPDTRTLYVACMPIESPNYNNWSLLILLEPAPPGQPPRVTVLTHVWQEAFWPQAGVAEIRVRQVPASPSWSRNCGCFWRDAWPNRNDPWGPCRPR